MVVVVAAFIVFEYTLINPMLLGAFIVEVFIVVAAIGPDRPLRVDIRCQGRCRRATARRRRRPAIHQILRHDQLIEPDRPELVDVICTAIVPGPVRLRRLADVLADVAVKRNCIPPSAPLRSN